MLYELSHFIKDKMGFLWEAIEWGNAKAFALRYAKPLKQVPAVLESASTDKVTIKSVEASDCKALAELFAGQPEESFKFFQPHAFDEKTLTKLAKRESQLMFIALIEGEIVGYCFMRSFVNGQTYRGYMVDVNHRGQGIAKVMGYAMNDVATALGLRMFKSIAPDNVASMAATKSVCDIKIIKTLENGDYYLECFAKPADNQVVVGGV